MKKYGIFALIFICLVALTYFMVFKDCDFNLLITSIKSTNPFYLILAFLCVTAFVLLGSLFLKRMLYHFNYKVSYFHTLGYYLTEIYFSGITPSYFGGQPIQMYEMKKDKIPYQKSSVIILFYSMMNRVSLIIWAIILFSIYHSQIFNLNPIYKWLVILGFITTIMVIGFFATVIYSKKVANLLVKLGNYFIDKFKFFKDKDALKKSLNKAIKEYQSCAKITKENKRLVIEAFIILPLQRLFLILTSFMVYKAFGLSEHSIFLVLAFQVCVTLGSDLMPTPGGVLVNESLLLIVNKILYGELALSGMLLLRTFNFYLLILLSGIGYLIFHFIKRKPAQKVLVKN